MNPALRALLAASLLATVWLALQPDPDDGRPPLPGPRAAGLASQLRPVPPLAQGRAPAQQTGQGLLAARAHPVPPMPPMPITPPALPTRPADWPAPGAAALAAWQGAPAAPGAAAAASAAAAPASAPAAPFPYQWIGRLDDGGAPQALLSSAQRSVSVRLGDVLDGRWRIDQTADGMLRATVLASGQVLLLRSGAPAAAP